MRRSRCLKWLGSALGIAVVCGTPVIAAHANGAAFKPRTTKIAPAHRDRKGVLHTKKADRQVTLTASSRSKTNGYPPPPKDRDRDGILDAKDACPDVKGLPTGDPETHGCAGDMDQDTIHDNKDACPREKGPPDPDRKQNGCPKAVRITDEQIVILQEIEFDIARATISKASDPSLDAVALVLNDHPEITKVEIQVHTDSVGGAKYNQRLSQDRAEAVKDALVKRGIATDHMIAKGYGQSVPIATNTTMDGRRQNRRVQFMIREKTRN